MSNDSNNIATGSGNNKRSYSTNVISKYKSYTSNLNANKFEIETAWSILSLGIDQIFLKNASALSYETLYRQAYDFVLAKKVIILLLFSLL